MVAEELRQLYAIDQLLKGITDEQLTEWRTAFEKQRSANGTVITSNCPPELKVGIKVYVHKDMRDTLNEYCTLSNTKLSDLIRELLINHLRSLKD